MTMATIKKITDKQGNDIYLRTHTKAVVDDNGYTAESRLQAMQDEINAAQLEIGAVPSDLTPTEGSTNWVTSGGVYNALNIGDANVEIDLSEYTSGRYYIGGSPRNVWLTTNNNYPYYSQFVPVVAGQKYRLIGNAQKTGFYAFMTSDTVGSNNSTVTTFASGYTASESISANAIIVVEAPSNARYLWLATYTTTDCSLQKLEEYNNKTVAEFLSNIDNAPSKGSENLVVSGGVYDMIDNTKYLKAEEVDITQSVLNYSSDYINYSSKKWASSANYPSFFVEILPNTKYRITANENSISTYALLTTNTIETGTTVSFATGSTIKSISAGSVVEFITPNDAYYLNYLYKYNGNICYPQKIEIINEVAPSVTELKKKYKRYELEPVTYSIKSGYVVDARISSETFGDIKSANSSWGFTQYIDVYGAKHVKYYANTISTSHDYAGVTGTVYYDENKQPLSTGVRLITYGTTAKAEWITEEIPSGARYMRVGLGSMITYKVRLYKITTDDVYGLEETMAEIDEKANAEEYSILRNSRYSADGATSGTVAFLHFSDIHGDEGAAQAIKAYYDKYSSYITDMLSTGDVVYYYATDGIDFYVNNGLTSALLALGNHDGALSTGSNVQGSADWDAKGAQWDYETYFAPYISGWNVTQPTDAATNYLMYYYKDYTTPKVRLIVLDVMHQDSTQLQWFQDTLADAITNEYTVVVASHYIPNTYTSEYIVKRADGDKTTFHSYASNSLTSIETRFKLNTSYADAVETFIDNDGKFAVWLCGHYHTDYFTYSDTHPNILFCAINQAGYRRGGSSGYRVVGDHCANMVTIHPASNLIKIHRIGITSDRYLRTINVVTYNYSSKKVISNY